MYVVCCFDDDNVVYVDGSVDFVCDKDIIDIEFIFKDIEIVEKCLDKLCKVVKSGEKEVKWVVEVGEKIVVYLESGKFVCSLELNEEGDVMLKEMMFFIVKLIFYVCNVDMDLVESGNEYIEVFKKMVVDENVEVLLIFVFIEVDIVELDIKEECMEFIEDMGLVEFGVNWVICGVYFLFKFIIYFIVGEKEVCVWMIVEGIKVFGVVGVIYIDFEKGFICVEVIVYNDYVELGFE